MTETTLNTIQGDMKRIADQWETRYSTVEFQHGPSQAASGAGAARIVRDYAVPAPQRKPQALYEDLGRVFSEVDAMKGDIKAIATAVHAIVAKAEDSEDEKDEDGDDLDHAKKDFLAAKRAWRRAEEVAEDDEENEEDRQDDLRRHVEKAVLRLRRAKDYLGKAEDAEDDDDDARSREIEELRNKIRALKREMSGGDKAEAEKPKKTEAAEKAGVPRRELGEVFDFVRRGRNSVPNPGATAFLKGGTSTAVRLDRLNELAAADPALRTDVGTVAAATQILHLEQAVRSGEMEPSVLDQRLESAGAATKRLLSRLD